MGQGDVRYGTLSYIHVLRDIRDILSFVVERREKVRPRNGRETGLGDARER
jgi:hypothetical protein